MKENLSCNSGYSQETKYLLNPETKDGVVSPYRGEVSLPNAHHQIKKYIPELFIDPNSIRESIYSAKHFHILRADEKQLHYSLKNCKFADIEFLLADLFIYHRESIQQSVAINQSDFIRALLSTSQSTKSLSGETPYKYFGWFVCLRMGCPVLPKSDLKCLKVVWSGVVRNNFSHELVIEYTDINGVGPKLVINLKEQTIFLPHVSQKTTFQEIIVPDDKSQLGQPVVFEEIFFRNNMVDISFQGDQSNHIGNQRIILPLTIKALYP